MYDYDNYKKILIQPMNYTHAKDVRAEGLIHMPEAFTYTWWRHNGVLDIPIYTGLSDKDKEWKVKKWYFSRLYRELGGTPGFAHPIHKSTGAQQHYKKWIKFCPELTKDDVWIEVRDYTDLLRNATDQTKSQFIKNAEHKQYNQLCAHFGKPILNRKLPSVEPFLHMPDNMFGVPDES